MKMKIYISKKIKFLSKKNAKIFILINISTKNSNLKILYDIDNTIMWCNELLAFIAIFLKDDIFIAIFLKTDIAEKL